jgi:hypothetical protein
MSSNALKDICRQAMDAARDGLAWIASPENAERVGGERPTAERQLKKSAIAARKALAAADRPMCVAVFGPSQAGKSYLVSVLARAGEAPLMARFDGLDHDVDFIRDINPGGDKESTGLVTRFSLTKEPSPPGFPVVLRLLSEIDIAKILANTYFHDSDPKKRTPLSAEAVVKALEQANSRQGPTPQSPGLKEEDIWDFQDYVEKQFAGQAAVDTLSAFWREAASMVQMLSIEDRAELLSTVWGGQPRFTALYVELVKTLEKLGHAANAYCPIEALVPRNASIIDVETLKGLGKPGEPTLTIRSMNGPAIELPRPVITALVAELRIAITDKPWPFFEHTDLLDFPGARSRQKVDLNAMLEEPDALKGFFVRGKVAFLFDRYVAEQELSSMLLCIRDSNQEVVTLPDTIDDWIRNSHGETAAERARVETTLFFVLTMFDKHFNERAGDEGHDPGDRFQARLGASLTGYFGKAHKWPFEWVPGKPFNNVFWLRNPNFRSEFLIRYREGHETEILPEKVAKVTALREGYLKVPAVTSHFADPARAFDEALKLNDGGVSYLAANLAQVCRPEIKAAHIRGRVERILGDIRRTLAPFYVDSDVNKRLDERGAVSATILQGLSAAWERNQLGSALRSLQISQNGIAEHLHIAYGNRLKSQGDGKEGKGKEPGPRPPRPVAAPSGSGRPPLPGAPPLPGRSRTAAEAIRPDAMKGTAPRMQSREDFLAHSAIKYWADGLHALAANGPALDMLGLDEGSMSELATELTAAARRGEIQHAIAEDLAKLGGSSIERSDMLLEKAGFFAASHINRFVSTLGFDRVPEDARPKAPDGNGDNVVPVFARQPDKSNCDDLGRERANFAYLGLSEWMYAFHQLVRDNVLAGEGLVINVAENERLKGILSAIDASVAGSAGEAGRTSA